MDDQATNQNSRFIALKTGVNSESTPEHDVLRIKKRTRGWEPVPRALITDVRLQFDTRGFAAWLLAKPPGWEIRASALPYLLKKERGPGEHIGRDKVRRLFRELEAAGYVTRRRMRKADGQWRWQIEFTDTPPTTPTRPGTVDGSAVDGSATGGTAVDGSGVDLLHYGSRCRVVRGTDGIRSMDVNGGGLQDIEMRPDANGNWYVLLSTGKSFVDAGAWASGKYANWVSARNRIYATDTNGDCLQDLLLGPDAFGN